MALIAFPGVPSIQYKGYYAYHTERECEAQRPYLENLISDTTLRKGINSFYLETYCLEMQAFENQLKTYEEEKKMSLGARGA